MPTKPLKTPARRLPPDRISAEEVHVGGSEIAACRMRRAASAKSEGSRTGSASLTASRMSGGMWFLVMYSTTPLGVETEIATSTESFGIVGSHFSTAVAISNSHSVLFCSSFPLRPVWVNGVGWLLPGGLDAIPLKGSLLLRLLDGGVPRIEYRRPILLARE